MFESLYNHHNGIEETQSKTYNTVIIEWDGKQPPKKWYRRRDELIGRVRGDKEKSTVERRADKGVIIQEGVILCASASLAKALAMMARDEFEVSDVWLGTSKLSDHFGGHSQDREIMGRIERTLSQRGRRKRPKKHVITCLEELQVYEHYTDRPLQCPCCHGLKIFARKGSIKVYADDGRDIVALWRDSRFNGTHFEPASIQFKETLTVDGETIYKLRDEETTILDIRDAQAYAYLMASDLLELVRRMPRDLAIDILDAVHVARAHMSEKERREARLEVVTHYFKTGGDPEYIDMAGDPHKPDLLDAAVIFEPKTILNVLHQYVVDYELTKRGETNE